MDNSNSDNFFYYNEDVSLLTLDPAYVRSQSEIWAVSQIFEGLVELDDSMRVRPCIARSWQVSDSGRVYTFYLKKGVWFHALHGIQQREVKAADFVFSFNRILSPETASPGSWIFSDKTNNSNPNMPAFEAVNDTVLIIRLNKPFPPFLSMLAMPYCFVVMPEAVDLYGKDFRNHPVGTGPFWLKIWEEDVRMLLHKNSRYHQVEAGNRLPYLDGVVIDQVRSKQTAFMGFVQGKYDFFNGIDAKIKDDLLTKEGALQSAFKDKFTLLKTPFLNTEFIGFLVDSSLQVSTNSPVANHYFRQALNYAIDRKGIVTHLRNGIGIPADKGFVPPGFAAYPYHSISGYSYFPDTVKKLLALAGYPHKFKEKTISINTISDYLDIAILLKSQLAKSGIDSKIEIHTGGFLRQLRSEFKISVFRGSWIADYPDPENFLACFFSPNYSPVGPNYTHIKSSVADSLYRLSMVEQNPQKRMFLLSQMDAEITTLAPMLLLYYDMSVRLVQPRIKGLGNSPMNSLKLKSVRKNIS